MNELKFRVWNKKLKAFSYWGFNTIDEVPGFASPATGSGVSISDCERLSEQYTGLKDMNGKEIYAGDIVDVELDSKHGEPAIFERSVVYWCEKQFRFKIGDINHESGYGFDYTLVCTIVGNIHKK